MHDNLDTAFERMPLGSIQRRAFLGWYRSRYNTPIENINNPGFLWGLYDNFERWCEERGIDPREGGIDMEPVVETIQWDLRKRSDPEQS